MPTRQLLTLAIIALHCTCVRAQIPLDTSRQLDRDIWFLGAFGQEQIPARNGIQFTEDGPLPYNDVRLDIDLNRGSAMLTDPGNGQVRAYTNGQMVVDASHRIMPGGENLEGVPRHNSALFIPDPTDCNRWRILHQGSGFEVRNYNAYYAEMDLSLPGNGTQSEPLGEITLGSRRIFSSSLNDAISEGMNAILKAPDSRESWLFMTSKKGREFFILDSDAEGIKIHRRYSLDSIFPDAFEPFDRVENNSVEYHEDEAGRGRLLIATQAAGDATSDGSFDYYDNYLGFVGFDRINGEFLNQQATIISSENDIRNLADALFSPDGTKIYWLATSNPTASRDYTKLLGTYFLRQYDFISDGITTLASTFEADISNIFYAFNYNMALGPNGKIYHTQFPQTPLPATRQNLSAVYRPNLPGIQADYVSAEYPFGALGQGIPVLPTFAVQPLAPEIRAAYRQLSCDSVEYLLDATTPPWGTAPFTYRWNTGETESEFISPDAGRYEVTVTDANGCEQYAILELEPVELDERAAPNIVQEGNNCPGSSLQLLAEVPASVGAVQRFTWQTPSGVFITANSLNITDLDSSDEGLYQLSYLDAFGCPGPTSDYELTLAPTNFSLGLDTIVCDTAYTFGVTGQLEEITWNNGLNGPEITVVSSGTYGFEATSPDGCPVSDSVEVSIQPPTTSVLPDTSLVLECEEATILPVLENGILTDFSWSSALSICPNCPGQTLVGEREGIIRLTATDDASGCPISDSTYLRILRNYDVYVPNAFSPNGDGVNDRFIPYAKSPEAVIEQFIIYNRWGGEVFSAAEIPANDPSGGWDGDDVESADINTYAYYLRLRFADGKRREIKGGVQLVR